MGWKLVGGEVSRSIAMQRHQALQFVGQADGKMELDTQETLTQ